MELSDAKILELLLRNWAHEQKDRKPGRRSEPKGIEPRVYTPTAYTAPSSKSTSRRCSCGNCPKCAENARWERIFQTKFADPEYYTRRTIPHGSPLSD